MMKKLDYAMLVRLNESSIRAGRRQNLSPERMPDKIHEPYRVNFHMAHKWDGQQDIRMSVILTPRGKTVWLDVSPEEFAAIPEFELSEVEWEVAMCPGTPPEAP
ncbi:MAG: hypothetical protein HYY20_04075 [Candidatus Tectomicrobia bacterium]|uniref:Uncharacterized protein n=1 Tax=Tectimicrobiota bacterium TaxID=2528274 RepID=A0A932CNR0_UNCTE|nr:hypothetical protein [Candidatus Tectomicrobia bacterium]